MRRGTCPLCSHAFVCYLSSLPPRPIQRLSCPTRILDGASTICASISCDCCGRSSCSMHSYFSTMPYNSIHGRISVSSATHVALSYKSIPWPSTCFRQSSQTRRKLHLFPNSHCAIAVLVQYTVNVSSSFLLNLNRRLMAFVFQPSILTCTLSSKLSLVLPA